MSASSIELTLFYLSNFIWAALIVVFLVYGQRIQIAISMRSISKYLTKLESFSKSATDSYIKELSSRGINEDVAKGEASILVNSFLISPTNMDPFGVVKKLKHLLDSYEDFFTGRIKALLPTADYITVQNLSGLAETALALNEIYKYARHLYLSAKNYNDLYSLVMLQVQMPFLVEAAEAYSASIEPMKKGLSIGDGLGPLVAQQLAQGAQFSEIVKDTEVAQIQLDGRNVIVLKAKGPGSTVGRPGEGVKAVMENYPIKAVITVDAGLKLEGEDSGQSVEGYGVAMGGPGTDRFEIEEAAANKNVPLYAVIVKMSLKEAIGPMNDTVRRAALDAVQKVKSIIQEKTAPGDYVIVAGIGNTLGIP